MLTNILATKEKELDSLVLPAQVETTHFSLKKALLQSVHPLGLIAEVKKASPSKGIICEKFEPRQIAMGYEKGGASAISVLTDVSYFQGHLSYIEEVKQSVSLPVLRKDFIISPLQVEETARAGADALLLIVGAIDIHTLHELYVKAYESGLECLVEVHSEEELKELLAVFTPEIIGVNNRDLKTFKTSLTQTEKMASLIPEGVVIVSESGIHTSADIERVRSAGAKAVLVGESLMRSEDQAAAITTLFYGEKSGHEA
ncbi:indole-3-glycerol phosphate synthase TrpC [Shouchella shacheensis]|uniref:indole-3-glycerol phosphate synthase TrpC n=1 Tax=Shouchella shacheensis TaxID=1649580 RepID=UPI0007403FF7|nr:indole-3-glycerol phosphate synthase TrpC [Shouchella shacheensis]